MEARSKYLAQLKATDSQVQIFRLRLEKTLTKAFTQVVEDLQGGDISALDAAKRLSGLETDLANAGLKDELDKLREIYADQLSFIQEKLSAAGLDPEFSYLDKSIVRTLSTFDENSIAQQVSASVDDISGPIMRTVITGQDIDSSIYSDDIDSLGRNLETDVNTSVLTFARTVTVAKAIDSGLDLFIYIGPDDKVTRPFCQQVLEGTYPGLERDAPIYSIDEIQKMDNEQGSDVLTTCGGWNCRHEFAPIDPEKAAEMGYGD